ncbi:methylamine dehydrogenase accessory protein MauD [Rhizobium sp. ARZ01]|uniref:methylamine dehydrogenase accessory protein MauD n=1 Tax=Rhizobium sp. ARZ01 TaxID=2769313 RepID=UPI0017849A99|nr:methylamine dehydrogenase accessory protein MauD [Rhizobium sp. ARZ01]MBD9375435.1 methylamine dehydrogenase accessory protein MauD [Rhizobium sp. ARZ01]
MSPLVFAVIVLWAALFALAVVIFALTRQIGILYERIAPVGALVNDSGPKIGEATPIFELSSLTGGSVSIGAHGARSTVVFFLSTTCPICKKMIPVLRSVQIAEASWLDVVLASDGDENKHRAFIEKAGLAVFPYVLSANLGLTYRVQKIPFAVLIDGDGIVRAKGLINNREHLESLFTAAETANSTIQTFEESSALLRA